MHPQSVFAPGEGLGECPLGFPRTRSPRESPHRNWLGQLAAGHARTSGRNEKFHRELSQDEAELTQTQSNIEIADEESVTRSDLSRELWMIPAGLHRVPLVLAGCLLV